MKATYNVDAIVYERSDVLETIYEGHRRVNNLDVTGLRCRGVRVKISQGYG
jgi:hypothetical protein